MEKFSRTAIEIEERIRAGTAAIRTIEEAREMVRTVGLESAFEKADVVVSGTFEPVEVALVHFQFPQANPQIRISKMRFNEVEALPIGGENTGILSASTFGSGDDKRYGGAQVIEELVNGEDVRLSAIGQITDTHIRKDLDVMLQLKNLNKAMLEINLGKELFSRGVINSSEKSISSSMGVLLPSYGNLYYSGSGENSPLLNSKFIKTLKVGTPVFFGGTKGYISDVGDENHKVLSLRGNLREMKGKYLRAGGFGNAGSFLFVGIGFAIPILKPEILEDLLLSNQEINVDVMDIGDTKTGEKFFRQYSYDELENGVVSVDGHPIKAVSLSSAIKSKEIAEELKGKVMKGEFPICQKQE